MPSGAPTAEARLASAIGHVLRWGTIAAGVLLLAALATALVSHRYPLVLTWAGLGALMLLPPLRIVLAAVVFGRQRDWKFVWFSLVALGVLVASNVAGWIWGK